MQHTARRAGASGERADGRHPPSTDGVVLIKERVQKDDDGHEELYNATQLGPAVAVGVRQHWQTDGGGERPERPRERQVRLKQNEPEPDWDHRRTARPPAARSRTADSLSSETVSARLKI